jgi:hypothetical protein
MACEAFVQTNFQARTLDVIEQANVIIDEYAAQGFTMTLRQLYYQASSPRSASSSASLTSPISATIRRASSTRRESASPAFLT